MAKLFLGNVQAVITEWCRLLERQAIQVVQKRRNLVITVIVLLHGYLQVGIMLVLLLELVALAITVLVHRVDHQII
jgi:hypothetical protein